MGQMLERPITAKESDFSAACGHHGIAWSSSAMQGWRPGMEDAHICLPELPDPWSNVAMFGVLDGHGGEQVAKFCDRHLPRELHSRLSKHAEADCKAAESPERLEAVLRSALTDSFHEMDEMLRSGNHARELQSFTNPPCPQHNGHGRSMPRGGPVDPCAVGCTCNICCITDEFILCANAGDSRAVLCRAGKAVALSEDHKPNDAEENRRIKAAGGYIETQQTPCGPQYRVNGNLNLSRALGDLAYKKDRSLRPEDQIICSTPDFICERRCPEDEFIVICCDGIWDVRSNQEVVDFVRARLPQEFEAPVAIMESLLDECVSPDLRSTKGLGGDNMTGVLIRLPPYGETASVVTNGFNHYGAAPSAHLLNVQVEGDTSQPGVCGNLVVRFTLAVAPPSLDGICVRFSYCTSEVELCLEDSSPQVFSLKVHLPLGTELCSPQEELSVKFFRKLLTLRVTLPWRRATSK